MHLKSDSKAVYCADEIMEEDDSPSAIHVELSRHVEEIVQVCGARQTRGGDSSGMWIVELGRHVEKIVQVCGAQQTRGGDSSGMWS